MKILKLHGFNSINLDQLEEHRNGNAPLPHRPIIITFDDCFQESVDYAVPILEANSYTAVFYVPTGYIGGKSGWLMPELGIEFPIIDWNTIKRLDSNGHHVGSHTVSHPHLTNISADECYKQLRGSREALENKLGHEVVHLAYPHGDFDERVRSIAAETGYRSACSCVDGLAGLEDDPLVLPRVYIKGQDSILDFFFKLHTAKKWQTPRKLQLYTHSKLLGAKRLLNRIIS